jgi:serine/threonine protein kinase
LKSCPTCRRLYPDDAGFCPVDGVGLLRSTDVPVAQSDEDPRVGSLLCMRYQIRRVVADGGMGRVYEALDLHDKAGVAVKVLHPDVARDSVSVERFKREFDVSKLLPHDHIVDVRDFAQTDDGTYALVMEFLDGEELRNVLKREKRLPPERIVRMLSQTAIGLDEAHRRQLVHRDLKPDNVFLCGTREGDNVKVLDFGSVKDKSSGAKKLTVMGTTIGSPFYMAPEQAQGLETLDARADVWALAAIAYECITGEVPFKGSTGPAILLSILTKEPIPPSEVAASAGLQVPPALDEVMEVALAKNPAIRTKSVGELADAIGRAYGLEGDHRAWAVTPQAELGARIHAALPAALARRPAAPPASLSAMDSAFQHSAPAAPTGDEMFVMGVPKGPPKWLVPAIVGGIAVVLGVIGTVLLMR